MADNSGYNPMQANMGLFPQQAQGPVGIPTPTPGETAASLMEQASQRTEHAQRMIGSTPMMIAAQFQANFQRAQSMQAMYPLQAQFMANQAQQVPGGGPSYLPSPMMMTPAMTGIFRPQMPSPMMPIPPVYTPPIIPMPFQPQIPAPMFQSGWDRQALTQDLQANRMFSYGMQAPSMMGQGMGIGAGAFAGAKLMGGFGPMGALAGAIGGGMLASRSGLADVIGDFSQLPFSPMIETRQMGAALQRFSSDWVVSGPQLHGTGRGLSRGAGIDLAGGIRDMASDSGFKGQTGGMFNRQDLMKLTQLSGQSGLMDMEQSVPAIQQQLRQVAVTVRKFMELTNDPDVTNVVREMGKLRQFGMTLPQIGQAADNMKMFSRGAGTSIAGLQAAGGLPGASVYQGMGLTAGLGFDYGNYSLMMARQTVASGGVNPQQLALFGGVQGMAQRNMQAQAAFTSMPMFAAANAKYAGGGDWNAGGNAYGMGGGQGAFGMVASAINNLNDAVRKGGLGALVSFPLQQQEIADSAASSMTPMQQTTQRFKMALQTGQRFRMQGMDAFNFGARILYGDEVASQMSIQAQDPGMWSNQQKMFRNRFTQASLDERQQTIDSNGFFSRLGRNTGVSGAVGAGLGAAGTFFGALGAGVGGGVSGAAAGIGDYFGTPEGVNRYRAPSGATTAGFGAKSLRGETGIGRRSYSVGEDRGFWGAYQENADFGRARAWGGDLTAQGLQWADGLLRYTTPFTSDAMMSLAGLGSGMSDRGRTNLLDKYYSDTRRTATLTNKGKEFDGKAIDAASTTLGSLVKNSLGMELLTAAGNRLGAEAGDYIAFSNEMSAVQFDEVIIKEIMASDKISREEAEARYAKLDPTKKEQALREVINIAKQHSPEARESLEVKTHENKTQVIMDKVNRTTEAIQDKQVQTREMLELGMYAGGGAPITGAMKVGTGYGSDTMRNWAVTGGRTSIDAAILAAVGASKKDKTAYRRALAFAKSKDPNESPQKFNARWVDAQKKFAGFSEEVKETLGTWGKNNLTNVEAWALNVKDTGVLGSLRSKEFSSMFTEYSQGLGGALENRVTSAEEFVGAMSQEEISNMYSRGTGAQKQLAEMALKVKQGVKGAREKFVMAAAQYAPGEVEDTALSGGTGVAAQAAKVSADAAGEMSGMASDFAPAVTKFSEASAMLLKAAMLQVQNGWKGIGKG